MKRSFEVLNVKCEGCASTLKRALEKEFGRVEVDLTKEPRIVTVDIKEDKDIDKLKTILRSVGYPLIEDEMTKVQSLGMKTKSFISCAVGKFTLSKE